jgi:hypothetical protein
MVPVIICGRIKVRPQETDTDEVKELANLQRRALLYVYGYDHDFVYVSMPHTWGKSSTPVPYASISGVDNENHRSRVFKRQVRDYLCGDFYICPGSNATYNRHAVNTLIQAREWNLTGLRNIMRNINIEGHASIEDYQRWALETIDPNSSLWGPPQSSYTITGVFYHTGVSLRHTQGYHTNPANELYYAPYIMLYSTTIRDESNQIQATISGTRRTITQETANVILRGMYELERINQ